MQQLETKSPTLFKEKDIILMARIVSMIFTPFYLPILGLIALFIFTYMSILPWQYKFWVLLLAYLFTILLPTLLIRLYRRYQGWTKIDISRRERRMIPYVITILCYFFCYYVMSMQRLPQFMANNPHGGTHHTDHLCHYQCMVENLHACCGHRRRRRFTAGLFCPFRLRSDAMVLYLADHCRNGRIGPHDPTLPFTRAGHRRLLHRTHFQFLDYCVR